jgi:hypothetical protein
MHPSRLDADLSISPARFSAPRTLAFAMVRSLQSGRDMPKTTLFVAAAALTLAAATVLNTACGLACGDAGCLPGLSVELSGTWPEGQYELAYSADDIQGSCTAVFLGSGELDLASSCTNGQVFPGRNGKPAVMFYSTAERIEVAVSREGTELVRRTYEPEYEENEPNGDFCDPTCKNAADTLALP